MSESYPHLQDGAMRDFISIMKDRGYWDDAAWHDTKHAYTFSTGSILEFKSIDTYGKAHGPRRDVLFINECNNLEYKIADQLITRTREIVWLDWNPTSEFWFYTEMQPHRTDIDFITLTYLDNEALLNEPGQVTLKEIETHRHNTNWWRVYAEGQLGDVMGRIYTGWVIINEIPHEAKLVRRGLDFGFSQDPLALVDIYKYNGGFIFDERLYGLGIHNKPVADFLMACEYPETLVFADSQEPKSIEEIAMYGVPIVGAHKGQGSIRHGIDYVQDQRISMTSRSIHLIKEYRNYMWEFDKDGRQLPQPVDLDNHCLDAIRYGLETYSYATSREAGIVTAGVDERKKSFIVNDKGEAEAFHVDLGEILNNNQRPQNRDWRHQ